MVVASVALGLETDQECKTEDGRNLQKQFYTALSMAVALHLIVIIKMVYYMYKLNRPFKEGILTFCLQCKGCYSLGAYTYI